MIFCDPDNGIRFDGVGYSPRYVALEEVRMLFGAGRSLVLYHTPGRSEGHLQQIRTALRRFDEEIPGIGGLWAAHFRRGSSRAFLVLAQPKHVDGFKLAFATMEQSPWITDGFFNLIQQEVKSVRRESSPLPVPRLRVGVESRPPEPARNNGSRLPLRDAQPGAHRRVRVVLNDNGGLNAAANPGCGTSICRAALNSTLASA